MSYNVDYKAQALRDLIRLQESEPAAFRKVVSLIDELRIHPKTGTGKPEQLSGDRAGQWSRRITKRHRLIYEIYDTQVLVLVLTAYGHYDDK